MKRPSFQFYPADWLSDMKLRMLSWASRGLYIELLCYCWREGWIPADSSAIAQLCGCHDLTIVEPCLQLFQPHPDDPSKLVHKRLLEEKSKQDKHREERSLSGKRGAKSRWNREIKENHAGEAQGILADSSAIDQPMAKNGSSTSTSTSSSNNKEESKVEFPENLQTITFYKTWEGYIAYRKTARMKPLQPASIAAQLKKLSAWGHDIAIAAINETIANAWQGIFFPKTTPAGTIIKTPFVKPRAASCL